MTELRLPARRLRGLHDRLFGRYGPQHWWPGDTPFEIMVGAVLTQNTAWTHVERAIDNLRRVDALDPVRVLELPSERLAELLRPSGYFNVKARRLKNFCAWYLAAGGWDALRDRDTQALRADLLAVNGIGPETADDILLYAFERAVFVIDAYTRRLFSRQGLIAGAEGYEVLRQACERALGEDVALYNEFHALIVAHAKMHCRPRPACAACPVRRGCHHADRGRAG